MMRIYEHANTSPRSVSRKWRKPAALLLALVLLVAGLPLTAAAATIFPSTVLQVDTTITGTEDKYIIDGVYTAANWFVDKSKVTGNKVTFLLASGTDGITGNTFHFDYSIITDMIARGITRVHIDTPAGTYTFAPTAFSGVTKGIMDAITPEQRKVVSMKIEMVAVEVDDAWLNSHSMAQRAMVTRDTVVYDLELSTIYPTDVTKVTNINYMTHKWNATDIFDSNVLVGMPYDKPKYENTTLFRLVGNNYENVGGLYNETAGLFRTSLDHFSEYALGDRTARFTDLDQAAWCKPYVMQLYSAGVIGDDENNVFKPNVNITRAEFAKMIVAAIQLMPSSTYERAVYKDVPDSAWFKGYAEVTAAYGLMSGADGYFRPNDPITRQEIAAIIYRAMKLRNRVPESMSTSVLNGFADAGTIPVWAREGLAAAVSTDILNGSVTGGRTYLNPKGNATHAQTAAMIHRYLVYYLNK